MPGKGRMRQFAAWAAKTMKLPRMAENTVKDSRRSPRYKGFICFLLILVMLIKRHRSFNGFEDDLHDLPMKKIFHGHDIPPCTQTIKDAAKKMDVDRLEGLHQAILKRAANNKVFNKTLMHGARAFAVDGVEPLASRNISCNGCSTRTFETNEGEVTEFFHRFVFLQSIGPSPHLLLGFEPQHSLEQRKARDAEADKAEGELTAAKPVVDRLRHLFPRLFDLGVGDALYANGPMFSFMRQNGAPLDMIAVLKKKSDEPMADAITVFEKMEPIYYYDKKRGEHVLMWESDGFDGIETCPYPLRVIKAFNLEGPESLDPDTIDWEDDEVHTWWLATGISKERLTGPQVFDFLRHRWDEENCAFNQLTQHWNFKHSYLHHEAGTQVMMYAFMIAFNLFQLFLHCCLRNFAQSSVTAISIVNQIRKDYATITHPDDGFFGFFDTS